MEPLQESGTVRFALLVGEHRVESIEVQESLPLSPELEQQLGREHWDYLLENPAYILIEGQKAASPTPG